MTIKELQTWVAADWRRYPENQASPEQQLALIMEELDEVAEAMRKNDGRKPHKKASFDLPGEITDLLISLVTFANTHDVDLTAEVKRFRTKLKERRK